MITELKARQSAKIRELRDALIEAGLLTLDQQAEALGLSRSTTWTICRANHKASGLTASIINRMLASPQLPPLVRAKILEYILRKGPLDYLTTMKRSDAGSPLIYQLKGFPQGNTLRITA
jgi:hypothetical protein